MKNKNFGGKFLHILNNLGVYLQYILLTVSVVLSILAGLNIIRAQGHIKIVLYILTGVMLIGVLMTQKNKKREEDEE